MITNTVLLLLSVINVIASVITYKNMNKVERLTRGDNFMFIVPSVMMVIYYSPINVIFSPEFKEQLTIAMPTAYVLVMFYINRRIVVIVVAWFKNLKQKLKLHFNV